MISIFDFINVYGLMGCAIALFWFYSRSPYNFWRKLNVKYVKPIPLFGNTAKIILQLRPFHEEYHKLYKAFGDEPYGGMYLMREPHLLIKDVELVSAILIKDFTNFCDRGFSLFINKNRELNPLNMHIFFTDGDRWRALRQKLSPVFTSVKLKQMHDTMLYCVSLLTSYIDEQLGENDSMDVAIKTLFEKLTIDVIGTCAFGIECNELKSNDKFGQMGRAIFKPRVANAVRWMLSVFSKRLVKLLKLRDIKKKVTDFFLNLTLDTVEYRRKNGVIRNDLLQLLMDLQNSHVDPKFAVAGENKNLLTNETFDEIDIAANSFLFFAAGYETTATTLSFCLYELALNQNIQQKLRSEVQQIKDKSQTWKYESFKEMTYMDAVISETLRKYPPVVILSRQCTENYIIPGTKTQIPSGTEVTIPVWSIHHDWKHYPNPEYFDPERFLGDKHLRPSGVFIPFGDGPRYCLGKRFADMEIKAALSEMILRYDVKPCAKTEIPLRFKTGNIMLQTTCGTWVNLAKRK